MGVGVRIKCRNCGRTANSEEFVLDPAYKMVVCPTCVKERKIKESDSYKKISTPEVKRPIGYDEEDVYIEKRYKEKMKDAVVVKKVNDEKVQYQCPKCNYKFIYNTLKKTPVSCPYCSRDISMIKF